ncbi:trimeric intracellular cation channel family protein [Leekyejoonella antrihumi]|uniref:Trimeric intracellular cation channel family protein n=1 Tax=Leekyejoonella antrihumi TaxID=1660198 RepID=A0A563E402_9MICO|nr:trimeric intracellular cation channel family protein [Leekyejoonella antrihumi]TWP36941.1 trimeric intracellular cation channel family protein [Leekyejoonella antrihumi]
MLTQNSDLQLVLDLAGVFIFALSGGLVAVSKRLDVVGVIVLAWVAGLGGGVIRDVLIGAVPPDGVTDWRVMSAACVAGVLTFFLHPRLAEISRFVRVLDAGGLSLFAVAGALKALAFAAPPIACVVVGVITAVGGGLMRDVIVGRIPEVLRRELYAVPALLGAVIVVAAAHWHHLTPLVLWLAVAVCFVVRMTAVMFDLNAPRPLRTGDHS